MVNNNSFFPESLSPAKGNQRKPSLEDPPTLDGLLNEEIWLAWRATALAPQIVSDLVTSERARAEFVEGCRLLGLSMAFPHQLVAVDMLEAGYETNAILFPRQSAKTETMNAISLGRCSLRPRYNAAMTLATLASKTSEVFDQRIMSVLEFTYPDEDSRPFRIYRGKGSEHVRFPNGSRFSAKTAKGASFRASSYDLVWIDESGEASPEQGTDLKGAIYPTFDTRDGGQLVMTGTAGVYRKGLLLWDGLQNPENGRLGYAMPDSTTEDELAAWEPDEDHPHARVRELIEGMHPGVASGLTTIEKVRKRYVDLANVEQFAREYGGIFGNLGEGRGVFDSQAFGEAGVDGEPVVPERFAIATVAAFNQSAACIVAAWRDEKGRACGYVLNHQKGTTWLAEAAAIKARRHNIPVVYDSASGPMRVEVEAMERMRPKPRLVPQNTGNVTAAAALLVKEVNTGNARHWRQPALVDAARVAVRRSVGPSSWALGRPPKDADADISAVEAWALALRWYDENPQRAAVKPVMAA